MDFLKTIKNFSKITNFSTPIDYFTMRFVPLVLLSCTLLMGFNQYAKTSLVCYASTAAHGYGFGAFLENACYLSEKYSFVLDNGNLEPLKHRNLYLWYPIILILQTSSLCLAKVLWIFIGNHSDFSFILQLANDLNVKESSQKLVDRLWQHHTTFGYPKFLLGYLLTKLISIIVFVGNLTFLYFFIFLQDYRYPYKILKGLIFDDLVNHTNSMFQSIVLCEVPLVHVSSINRMTAQCVLTWNIFYSKIFSIISSLLLLSLVLILCDSLKWLIHFLLKKKSLLGYLTINEDEKSKLAFVKTMNMDLYFLLLMISKNLNNIIVHELISEMYNKYKKSLVDKPNDDYVVLV